MSQAKSCCRWSLLEVSDFAQFRSFDRPKILPGVDELARAEGAANLADIGTFLGVEHEGALAQAIVDTVAEPLVVLDSDLRVVTASRSFYLKFHVDRQNTQGQRLYVLGDGQWDIPDLGCGWKKSYRSTA